MDSIRFLQPWSDKPRIRTIDAHTGGEPFRVIIDGFPSLEGNTMLERREFARANYDHFRKALMLEPRGHADMYGCVLTPPEHTSSDIGVLFIHNEGFSTMCGHGIIALATVLGECGYLTPETITAPLRIDTPAGTVTATLNAQGTSVQSVSFLNVPSYVVDLNQVVHVNGLGDIIYDLAFGGAYYAYVDARTIGISTASDNVHTLIDVGKRIKRAVQKENVINHPFDEDMSFLYGVIFTEVYDPGALWGKNVCIFADGEVDRSPTGTGVSGRLAIHFARNEIVLQENIAIESIIGSQFVGSVVEEVRFGSYDAVVPRVEGSAFITGVHEFILDPDDMVGMGFMLR